METRKLVIRSYIVTQKELKDMFGLKGDIKKIELWFKTCKGDIKKIELWSGLSPQMEEDNVSEDVQKFMITTEDSEEK